MYFSFLFRRFGGSGTECWIDCIDGNESFDCKSDLFSQPYFTIEISIAIYISLDTAIGYNVNAVNLIAIVTVAGIV